MKANIFCTMGFNVVLKKDRSLIRIRARTATKTDDTAMEKYFAVFLVFIFSGMTSPMILAPAKGGTGSILKTKTMILTATTRENT